MIELAAEQIAYDTAPRILRLPRQLVLGWPGESALNAPFALTSAAAEVEHLLLKRPEQIDLAYKMAALLSADVLATQTQLKRIVYCADVHSYWKRSDPYFLTL